MAGRGRYAPRRRTATSPPPVAAQKLVPAHDMGRVLVLGLETPGDLRAEVSVLGSASAFRSGRPRIRVRRAGALGGVAVETIRRFDGKHGLAAARILV
jgi:hypothetical protein